MDMTVLERQQARLKWLPQQQYSYVNQNNSLEPHPMPQLQGFYHQASLDGAMFDWKKEPAKLYFGDNELVNYNNLSVPGTGLINAEVAPHSLEIDQCLPRTSGFQAGVAGKMAVDMVGQDVVANDVALVEKKQFSHGRDSARKRKAEFVAAEECNKKRTRGEAEVESRVQEKGIAETSAESSKDQNISEVQKPGYIHVQARRGQATDSHSLAERARRDKISKKIKCLQDLVPSCNKMMGRAGMLDEIINYVQSLQRQVEFLSIKIAALNPNMESNNDNFSGKEFSAYVASSPAASVPSAIANLPHLQHALAQKAATSSEQDLLPSPAEIPSERITSSSPFISEQLLNSSHFSEVQPFWNADCQNLHSVDFPSRHEVNNNGNS